MEAWGWGWGVGEGDRYKERDTMLLYLYYPLYYLFYTVISLLDKGADPNTASTSGVSILHQVGNSPIFFQLVFV